MSQIGPLIYGITHSLGKKHRNPLDLLEWGPGCCPSSTRDPTRSRPKSPDSRVSVLPPSKQTWSSMYMYYVHLLATSAYHYWSSSDNSDEQGTFHTHSIKRANVNEVNSTIALNFSRFRVCNPNNSVCRGRGNLVCSTPTPFGSEKRFIWVLGG